MGKLTYSLFVLSTFIVSIQCFYRDSGEPLFLTNFIERGETSLAKNLSLVRHKEMDWLTSYSGYVTVNKQLQSNMFFWFFPAKYNAKTAPLVIWLQGGPGSSSLLGLFKENGPFVISGERILFLKQRKHSWHIDHNLLYIDSPVGTGFSFTSYDAGYSRNHIDIGNNLYSTLQQFLTIFPEFRENPLYITGGKNVPALAYTILRNSYSFTAKTKINLQGLAVANDIVDPVNMLNYGDVLYENGMIDSNGLKIFEEHQRAVVDSINKRDFVQALYYIDHLILNKFYKSATVFTNLTGSTNYYNVLKTDKYDFSVVDNFLNRPDVRAAINVGGISFLGEEDSLVDLKEEERRVAYNLRRDIMQSISGWLIELLKHYKVFVISGQLDIIAAYPLTENFLKKLQFDAAAEYKVAERYIWKVDDEIAGYVKQAGNLTEVLVRNAGHFVGMDQPKWFLDVLTKLTSGVGFQFDDSKK